VSYPGHAVLLFTLALSSFLGLSVSPAPDPMEASPSASDAVVPLGQPFVLGVGEGALFEDGFIVLFDSVVGDSRCPSDVECVWEGNAEVAIAIRPSLETPTLLSLNTNPGFATEVTYVSYAIALIDLEPYPRTDRVSDEPYRATLVVSSSSAVRPPRCSRHGTLGAWRHSRTRS